MLKVNITSNTIISASFSNNARLVYISACKTGANSTSSNNVCNALIYKVVSTVVAFEENISQTTATDGCNRFNSIFVYKWINGYTVYEALRAAKEQIYTESGSYWGTDSYIVFGNGNLTLY